MKSFKVSTLAIVSGFLLLPGLQAQSSGRHNYGAVSLRKNQQRMPQAFEGFRIPPSAGLRFLASEEGTLQNHCGACTVVPPGCPGRREQHPRNRALRGR
jgi:hypothetical protein